MLSRRRVGRGFTLVELAVVLVLAGALVGLIALLGGETRRQARLGEDIAKLQRIGSWTASYGADNQDQYWTFSWKKGVSYPMLGGGVWPAGATDIQAAANQAIDLLQRAGRVDILLVSNWLPHVFYSHLTLESYVNADFPDFAFVSAGDRHRLQWARDPRGFDLGQYQPAPSGAVGTNAGKRWPYSASFQLPPAFYDNSPAGQRMSQASTHAQYVTPAGLVVGGRLTADAAFPSMKVLMHDYAAWHFGPRASHFAYPEMRMPLLFCDGSATVRAAGEANPGWHPNQPTSLQPTIYNYQPDQWEPPTLSGSPSEQISAGRFRWTRGCPTNTLAGRDFGGPEACPPLP